MWFKQTQERVAKLEETNNTLLQIKYHLEDHGQKYLFGVGGFVAGYMLRGKTHVTTVINQTYTVEVEELPRLY